MDERTRNQSICYYAHVLVEIDMTKGCEEYVMFEYKGQVMFASLKYEQLPTYCNHCGIVGHSIDNCRSVKGRQGEESMSVPKQGGKHQKEKPKVGEWV